MSTRYICPHCTEEQDSFDVCGEYTEHGTWDASIPAGDDPYEYDVNDHNSNDSEYRDESWSCPNCNHDIDHDFVQDCADSSLEVFNSEEGEEEEEEEVTTVDTSSNVMDSNNITGMEDSDRAVLRAREVLDLSRNNDIADIDRLVITCPICGHLNPKEDTWEQYCAKCTVKLK